MIVDATRLQAMVIAKRMDPVLIDQANMHGIDARRAHLHLLEQSAFSRAWIKGGKCLGLGGVVGTMLSSEGLLWLCFDREARRYPKLMIQHAALTLQEIGMTYRKLTAYVDAARPGDIRFAEYFGFRMQEMQERNGMRFYTAVREVQ